MRKMHAFSLAAQALGFGVILTLVLFGLSYVAAGFEFKLLSHILYWQGWSLQALVPLLNIGTLVEEVKKIGAS